jgi:hypothetical protein
LPPVVDTCEIEVSSMYPSSYNRMGISSEDQVKDGVEVSSASNADAVGETGSPRSSKGPPEGKSSIAVMNR